MHKGNRLIAVLLSLFLLVPSLSLMAKEPLVIDDADLFTAEEEAVLEEKCEQMSSDYNTTVWVYTSSVPQYSDNYARDMLESTGESEYPAGYLAYGINMSDRSYWVDAYGDTVRSIFTQSKQDRLSDAAADKLKEGNYFESAMTVLEKADKRFYLKTTSMGWLKKPFVEWKTSLLLIGLSLILALVIALIRTGVKVGRHKDKKLARKAAEYEDALNLKHKEDRFVRAYQTRVKVESDSPSHGGGFSGGGSAGHTGSGGHF